MKPITEEWLDRARDDLDVALEIISIEHLTNMVVFHAQQAVEKALKAIVEEFGIGFAKIHNLERLLGMVRSHMTFDVDLNMIKRLDEVYTSTRYPGDFGLLPSGKPAIQDAKELFNFADALYAAVKQILGKSIEEAPKNDSNNEKKNELHPQPPIMKIENP